MTPTAARSIAALSASGSAPAATALIPSPRIAAASTVAVVRPSPASSDVRVAAWRISRAPMSAKRSASSISSAIRAPSRVIRGAAPPGRSISTVRPAGPRLTRTASASTRTPPMSLSRATPPKASWDAVIFYCPFYCPDSIAPILLPRFYCPSIAPNSRRGGTTGNSVLRILFMQNSKASPTKLM